MSIKSVFPLLLAVAALSACGQRNDDAAASTQPATPADTPTDTPAADAATTEAQPSTDPAAQVQTATLSCGEVTLRVTFTPEPDEARVEVGGAAAPVVLQSQRPASGIWYAGNGYELRGKGPEATWTAPNQAPLNCTQVN